MLIDLHSYTVWAIGLATVMVLGGSLALVLVLAIGMQNRPAHRRLSRRQRLGVLVGVPAAAIAGWAVLAFGFMAVFKVGA